MPEYEMSYRISYKHGVRAYCAYNWRVYCVYIVSSLFVFVLSIIVILNDWLMPLACFGLGAVCVYWYGWISGFSRLKAIYSKQADSEVKLKLGEQYITFTSSNGTSSIRYGAFSHVYRMKHYWVLVRSNIILFSYIPATAFTPDAGAFFENKLQEAKARIQ
jgi:hypothetical protein